MPLRFSIVPMDIKLSPNVDANLLMEDLCFSFLLRSVREPDLTVNDELYMAHLDKHDDLDVQGINATLQSLFAMEDTVTIEDSKLNMEELKEKVLEQYQKLAEKQKGTRGVVPPGLYAACPWAGACARIPPGPTTFAPWAC